MDTENVQPRISELEVRANGNALQLLRGPWTFTCDRCETKFDAELSAGGIEELLAKGQVNIECADPVCEDRFLFSNRRHVFRMSLHDLIEIRVRA